MDVKKDDEAKSGYELTYESGGKFKLKTFGKRGGRKLQDDTQTVSTSPRDPLGLLLHRLLRRQNRKSKI